MNYVSIQNLQLQYGDKIIFDDLTLYINQGDKIALVAKNGSGKSTLFQVILNQIPINQNAQVSLNSNISLGYLEQMPFFDENANALTAIFNSKNPSFSTVAQYKKAELERDEEKISFLTEQMNEHNLWSLESKAKEILYRLDIRDLELPLHTFSGGQLRRIALARVLLEQPDFLMLDEPTNHLDPAMILWLEQELHKSNTTLLFVSHDRYFINKIANKIYAIDQGIIKKYEGNYTTYLEKKAIENQVEQATIAKARNLYSRELEWMRRQPKARSTKAKSRIENFDNIESVAKRNLSEQQVKMSSNPFRLGSKVINFHSVSKKFGENVLLDKFSYKFTPQDKIGIIGKNGVGKSTFIKMILGLASYDSGTIDIGDTVRIGYFSQQYETFDEEMRLIEAVTEIGDVVYLSGGQSLSAAQLLENFLFERGNQYTPISKLSGGEKRRLSLVRILMKNPNVLILDEPTNDLDIMTLNILADYVSNFEGSVIVISHDRFFLDQCVDHVFYFPGQGKIQDHYGQASEYFESLFLKENSAKLIDEEPIKTEKTISYETQKEIKQLENSIAKYEEKIKDLEDKMIHLTDYDEIMKKNQELQILKEKLDQKTDEWLSLLE
ncbi:MAG: ABC-F family ATP-binding cassette domain-containing protein [Chitinophagales bacterium]|nr:ABC-F family ATP-binding cassette domain-containing protein [Chitinophagales bacterium]